jgi:hypothetical protein
MIIVRFDDDLFLHAARKQAVGSVLDIASEKAAMRKSRGILCQTPNYRDEGHVSLEKRHEHNLHRAMFSMHN